VEFTDVLGDVTSLRYPVKCNDNCNDNMEWAIPDALCGGRNYHCWNVGCRNDGSDGTFEWVEGAG
jgi:hypothetical protein